jgi:nucleotide-binding universal stress UspA family protein
VGGLILGSLSEDLLSHSHHPILLVGPNASIEDPPPALTLVAGVERGPTANQLLPTLLEWNATFDGPPPWLVEVSTEDTEQGAEVGEPSDVHWLAQQLEEHGIISESEVAHARNPTVGLTEFADRVIDAVIVVASSRWTDPQHHHLRSVARRLTHQAHQPVLVVPASRLAAFAD